MGAGLSARRVSFELGGSRLLNEVSLEVGPGQLCAIVGPSGAGKSTLLKVLCGLRRPERGQVSIAGQAAHRATRAPDLIGYVPQDDIVHRALRVGDVFRYTAELRMANVSAAERARRVDDVLGLVDLQARRNLRVRQLSGGQRKRVSIGVELLTEPRVLFLDEPTSGLDPGLERQLTQTLRELARGQRTVVLTTHVMESMDAVDLLAVVCEGHLAFAGPPAAALEFFRVKALRELFDSLKKQPGRTWHQRLERARPQLTATAPRPAPAERREPAAATKAAPAPDVDDALAALKRKMEGTDA